MKQKIFLGSDHAGVELKSYIMSHFNTENKFEFIDVGTNSPDTSVDYPDIVENVASKIKKDANSLAILICGTGIGMSIAANRYSHIRAALCYNNDVARLAKEHNNANILIFGARQMNKENVLDSIKIFLSSKFLEGRHSERLSKIKNN